MYSVEDYDQESESHLRPLTNEEQCALRYVTEYTIRKVYEKMQSSSHPNKENITVRAYGITK